MAITSSASISSEIRMAPSCAVAPAPIVAARAIPAVTGAAMRTLMNAAKKPVSASTPMSPSEANPWIANSVPAEKVMNPTEAAKWADVIMVCTPDELQAALWRDDLKDNMKKGAAIAFAHGLNIHFKLIEGIFIIYYSIRA